MLNSENIDIVFLDNFLHIDEGVDSIAKLKQMFPKVKIVLMSSVLDVTMISSALENGADFLLDKMNNLKKSLEPILTSCDNSTSSKHTATGALATDNDNKTIAILEDEESFSLHLSWILKGLSAKTEIQTFSKVSDLINVLESEHHFDFIFSDYYLPDGNLKDVLPFIKSNSDSTRVVAFSSRAQVEEILALKADGIDDYIPKNDNWKINFLNTLRNFNLF